MNFKKYNERNQNNNWKANVSIIFNLNVLICELLLVF